MSRAGLAASVAAALVVAAAACRAGGKVSVPLEPLGDSKVSGTAVLSSQDGGTTAELTVTGIPAGGTARATLQAGTCTAQGASSVQIAEMTSGEDGTARARAQILFRGAETVPFEAIADGQHIVRIAANDGSAVACGTVPKP